MLSAVIITKDEEQHIEGCLSSIIDVVDEVVIVDAESSDRTRALAGAFSDKVATYVKRWEGYGAARNYGAHKASHPFIFSIDADERCDSTLANSIAHLRQEPSLLQSDDVFVIKRINIYKGKKMLYGVLAPEVKPRLYDRRAYHWDDRHVHELLRSKAVSYTHLTLPTKRIV